MQELLTPETSHLVDLHNNIFLWFSRFDVIAGILAGTEYLLGRHWYHLKEQHDTEQANCHPGDLCKQFAMISSINQCCGLDMAQLYAEWSRRTITFDVFVSRNEKLEQKIERAKKIMREFSDSKYFVHCYANQQVLAEENSMDPCSSNRIRQSPMWDVNCLWIDLLSTETMHKYQTMLTLRRPLLPDLQNLAVEQYRLIATMDSWSEEENGVFIGFNNNIGIISMILPKDEIHQMWCRRKMAFMERNG